MNCLWQNRSSSIECMQWVPVTGADCYSPSTHSSVMVMPSRIRQELSNWLHGVPLNCNQLARLASMVLVVSCQIVTVGVNAARFLNSKHVQGTALLNRLILFLFSQISSGSEKDAIGAAIAGM